jgi:hypothetical protein
VPGNQTSRAATIAARHRHERFWHGIARDIAGTVFPSIPAGERNGQLLLCRSKKRRLQTTTVTRRCA